MSIFILFIILSVLGLADGFELIILHNNDFNAEFEESPDNVGGIARTIHYVKQAREQADSGDGPPVLVLVSGNCFGESIWYSIHRWRIVVDFLNILKPDAFCLGPREFDDGLDELQNFVENLNFPVVGTNLEMSGDIPLKQHIQKHTIVTKNGKKILITGYTDKGHATTKDVIFNNIVKTMKDECKNIKELKVDFVVAVSHAGFTLDRKVALNSDCIQVIVGGGSDMFMYTGKAPSVENPTGSYPAIIELSDGSRIPIGHAYKNGKYLGKMTLKINDKSEMETVKGEVILMAEEIPEDSSALELLSKYAEMLDRKKRHIIGKTLTTLDGHSCNHSECTLGNLIADSFCDYKATQHYGIYWTTASIAFINSGAIKASQNISRQGKLINEAFLYKALPYQQQLMTIRISGKTLLSVLEHSMTGDKGAFLQVAGLRIVYNMTSYPYNISVMVRCAQCEVPNYVDLNSSMEYDVITTKYLVEGGDGYQILTEKKIWFNTEVLNSLQATMKYIQDYKRVLSEIEGRVVTLRSSAGINGIYCILSIIFLYLLILL